MFRTTINLVACAVVAMTALTADQAQAGWRHRHGYSGGGWGSYGSGGSSGCWGSSGGYYGSSGGSWGSSGGSYGSWGSSGGSWGSSGGSWGSGGSSGGTVIYDGAPAMPAQPTAPADGAPDAAPAPPAEGQTTGYHPTYGPVRNSAMLSVRVPADAKVIVNGVATKSTGSQREYISRGLRPGAQYSYEIQAEVIRDGKPVIETKTVQLTVGDTTNLDFAFDGSQDSNLVAKSEPVQTKLVVHVPAEAKIFLAGQETRATGELREFATSKLAPGTEWNDYVVRAVIERDGHPVTKEQTISLKAGENRELSFDFDVTSVADRVADASR